MVVRSGIPRDFVVDLLCEKYYTRHSFVWYGYGDTVASGFKGEYIVHNFSMILGPSKLDGKTM